MIIKVPNKWPWYGYEWSTGRIGCWEALNWNRVKSEALMYIWFYCRNYTRLFWLLDFCNISLSVKFFAPKFPSAFGIKVIKHKGEIPILHIRSGINPLTNLFIQFILICNRIGRRSSINTPQATAEKANKCMGGRVGGYVRFDDASSIDYYVPNKLIGIW